MSKSKGSVGLLNKYAKMVLEMKEAIIEGQRNISKVERFEVSRFITTMSF